MRLRPLTEAECYARCYGGLRDDSVNVVRVAPHERRSAKGEQLRVLFERRLDQHGPEAEAA